MDTEALVRLLDAGRTHAEIAKEFGCTRPAVSYAAKKLGKKPNKAQRPIDVNLLKSETADNTSFSAYAKKHNHTLASVSRVAKKHDIDPPGINHKRKKLPDKELLRRYEDGTSLDSLSKSFNTSVATIKRHLKSIKHDIIFRTIDEAVRPKLLNDRDALLAASEKNSYRAIAKQLGVKLSTVTKAARRFGLSFPHRILWDNIDYHELLELYIVHGKTTSQIAIDLGYPYGVVLKQLRRAGFPIANPGGVSRPSKYLQLNDHAWLAEQYKSRSANDIAETVGASVGMVLYHLRKAGISMRSKEECIKLIMEHIHGIRSEYRGIKCHSQLEKAYLKGLPEAANIERDIQFESFGSHCAIDFRVDGDLIEVKPKDVLKQTGPDRKRMIKQFMICQNNNVSMKVWTKAGYWQPDIVDDDILHAINWKLFFASPAECHDWLLARGFVAPRYGLLDLVDAAARMIYCKVGQELNAGFNNHHPLKLTHHFFPHFWGSTHKNYIPVSAVWEVGNTSVLKAAVANLWQQKREVNIYGLLKYVAKYYKDFATVSWFKPWVAKYVYDLFLPDGGTVIDPCCGWGGRFMAAVSRDDIKYIGSDLNELSVSSHQRLRDFLGSRVCQEPQFHTADATLCDFPDADLLFTSPPYDDTEIYHGINSLATKTEPILHNIFSKFKRRVILNVPKRMEDLCIDIAKGHGRKLSQVLKMRTSSFMKREKTHEPILVWD